jgi:hypothetical protein|tara:strand:+ start:599 stop:778 length:180 start_codon:yes stop_codon:yes gene_type:complete
MESITLTNDDIDITIIVLLIVEIGKNNTTKLGIKIDIKKMLIRFIRIFFVFSIEVDKNG